MVAFITVKPGTDDAFVTAAKICVAASRSEAGTIRYELWREIDGERRFVFNELYSDRAAVERHMASKHFKEFGQVASDLWAAPPDLLVTYPIDIL